jgi:hypothetical protein
MKKYLGPWIKRPTDEDRKPYIANFIVMIRKSLYDSVHYNRHIYQDNITNKYYADADTFDKNYDTVEEAMEVSDKYFAKYDYKLLTQEEYDKLRILI